MPRAISSRMLVSRASPSTSPSRTSGAAQSSPRTQIFINVPGVLHRSCAAIVSWRSPLDSVQLVTIDFSAFHHECHSLERGNIFKRILFHRDDIGEFSLFDGADTILPAEQVSGLDGSGLNRFERSKTILHVNGELLAVVAVRNHGRVGAKGDAHAHG